MKAIKTWVLCADARHAQVMTYDVAGKRLLPVDGTTWTAEPPSEYADEAGVMQSRVGSGRATISRADPALQAEIAFAKSIVGHMTEALDAGRFDRLIIAAAPHMLGVLREEITPDLRVAIHAEVGKDLANSDPEKVMRSLESILSP